MTIKPLVPQPASMSNERPEFDQVLQEIADYVLNYQDFSALSLQTAELCLMDSLGCGLLALQFPECTKLLGPTVPGTQVPHGARVFGTAFTLDPITAAWDIGCLIRWLDYNDTWLAAEWGHPSDNLGAILAIADHVAQVRLARGEQPLTVLDVLKAMIMAHEVQGVLALENSFNRVGLCHVLLVRVASTAVATFLLGGTRTQILSALSHAWVDGSALRTYRHAPNTGSRKSWAAGDASARGVQLAYLALRGEMGIPSVLTAPQWGFYDVSYATLNQTHQVKPQAERTFKISQEFKHYVMENILFKVSYPAEFHAQTAVEAAIILHPKIKNRLSEISQIKITTHESAIRIIAKEGPLYNPADRDHCLQYMVAVGLLEGTLKAEHYENNYHHQHPMIDQLRNKMVLVEDAEFSQAYLDASKRSIANAIQIFFNDGTYTEEVAVHYPLGHKFRRDEAIPLLKKKFKENLQTQMASTQATKITSLFEQSDKLCQLPINRFVDCFITPYNV